MGQMIASWYTKEGAAIELKHVLRVAKMPASKLLEDNKSDTDDAYDEESAEETTPVNKEVLKKPSTSF